MTPRSLRSGRKSWEQIFPHLPKGTFTRELEHILDEMLQFDPEKRCSVKEALEMEYLKDLHDPKDEPECEHPVDWSFDNALQPTKRAIQLAIYGVREHGWPHQLKAHVLGGCRKSLQGAVHSASNSMMFFLEYYRKRWSCSVTMLAQGLLQVACQCM